MNACSVCYHKFTMTRSKRQCHGCARTVCKRCTRGMHFFDEHKQMSTTGIARLRFCHNCIKHARSEASDARQSADASMETNRRDNLRALATDTSGVVGKASGGSSSTSHSLHRVSSQASSSDGSVRGASSHPNDGLRYMPRVPSSDSLSSIPRTPSVNSMGRGRAPSPDGANNLSMSHANPSLSQSTLSYSRTQPEAEYSDGEDVPFEDGYTPTTTPTTTPVTKSTTVFASSKVSNAYDGSPINEHPIAISQPVNLLESSHVGQYSNFKIQALAGDSEDEGDGEDDDFGDFHDSDSEDDVLADAVAARQFNVDSDGSFEYDFDHIGDLVDHTNFEYPDPDEYSVAGSFSYDGGVPSFMSSLHDESFSYEPGVSYPPTNGTSSYDDGSRGSFVPLTLVDTPSIVAQVAAGRQPPVITPQLRQQQPQHTLRTYGHPAAMMPPTLDETSEFDSAGVLPPPLPPPPSPSMVPLNKNVARTGSTPNLLAYGSTKRTNRPGGAGMAPVRRVVSSEARTAVNSDMNELSNGFSARLHLQSTPEMAARKQPGFNPSASGGTSTSPLIRYYGS